MNANDVVELELDELDVEMPDADEIEPDGRMTVRQASEHAGVTMNTVRRWAKEGQLEGEKNDAGHWRFTVEAVEVAMNASPATAEPTVAPEGFATMNEIDEHVSLHPQYVRKLLKTGKIEGHKNDAGHWLVNIESAVQYDQRPSGHSRSDGRILHVVPLTDEEVTQLEDSGFEVRRKNRSRAQADNEAQGTDE